MNKISSIINNVKQKTKIETNKTLMALMLLFAVSSCINKDKTKINDYEWQITKIEKMIESNKKLTKYIDKIVEENKERIQSNLELQITTQKEYSESINKINKGYADLMFTAKEIAKSDLKNEDKEYLLKKISIYMQ